MFLIIDRDGNMTHQYLDRPDGFNYEMRDPNLSMTRDGRMILSGFAVDVNENATSYMMLISFDVDGEIHVDDYNTEFVPETEYAWGNTIQDANGYLYKCTYGANSSHTINIYKSTEPLGTDLPEFNSTPFASFTPTDNGKVSEPTIAFYKDEEILLFVRREAELNTTILARYDFSGILTNEITYDNNMTIHSPVLLPYYNDEKIVFGGSYRVSATRRRPIIGIMDIDTAKFVTTRMLTNGVFVGGYPSLVPIGDGIYGMTYYADDGENKNSAYNYIRVQKETFLNTYYC